MRIAIFGIGGAGGYLVRSVRHKPASACPAPSCAASCDVASTPFCNGTTTVQLGLDWIDQKRFGRRGQFRADQLNRFCCCRVGSNPIILRLCAVPWRC
jgi:hypothetical protein